jgi:signal transduction histidine kinase
LFVAEKKELPMEFRRGWAFHAAKSRKSEPNMPRKTAYVADYLENHKQEILRRWRRAAKQESKESKRLAKLDDQELLDHIPAITDAMIAVWRGKDSSQVSADCARHGHQRRLDGYTVIDVMWELTIFRRVFLTVLRDASKGVEESVKVAGQETILDLLDLCTRCSVERFLEETEQERDEATAKATNLEVQRERFLGMLSHELRNQIQPILFALRRLHDTKPSDQQLRALQMIERQTRQQSFLIDELFDLNSIRFSKVQLRPTSVDLSDCVRHGVEANLSEMNAKALNVEMDFPEEPVYARVDRERMCQVATNLMSNAVKFTPNGGTIVWRVFEEPDAAVMSVRDTGAGIKKEDLAHIFEMFYQGEVASSPRKSGLGIGLTVVQNLVEMHGGTIEVHVDGESTGAEFVVRMPRAQKRKESES